MQADDWNKVWEIKVLKRKPRKDEAQKILERIAKQVQPIMRKHNWRVKVLSEMHRKDFLGFNYGAGNEIKLTLRMPNNELEFCPFDEVLDTMLHELCHNVYPTRHTASFYKLWDQLRKECEELIGKGIIGTGEGFDLPGRRLGGFSRQPPLSSLRKTALDAAENRQKLNSILLSGPLRIGGDKSIMTALSPVQAAAMAAERRFQDEIWCASASNGVNVEEESSSDLFETIAALNRESQSVPGSSSSCGGTSRKRSNSSYGGNLIDLTSDINSPSNSVQEIELSKRSRGNDISEPNMVSSSENKNDESVMWTCEKCTLLNPALALICEACETLKPKDVTVKYKFWNCRFCTLENSISLDKCSACDQWRYSRGASLSALPPNLGT